MLTLLSVALAASASDVHVLGNDNFDSFLASNDVSLIEFYAPWCGHCKALTPKYEEAATALKGIAALAKVDCTSDEGKEVCNKYGVRGYPTLKVFRSSGDSTDFNAPREVDSIVSFMKKQTQPSWIEVKDQEGLTSFQATKLGALVFVDSLGGSAFKEFETAANAARDHFDFAVSTSEALAASLGASVPSAIIFRTFDEPKVILDGSVSAAELLEFLRAESFPLLGEINADTYQKYMERGLPLFYFFVDPSAASTDAVKAEASAAAGAFKGKLSFVTLDGVKWARFMTGTFSIKDVPAAAIHEKKKIYLFNGDLKTADIKKFAEDFEAGKLTALFKSQDIPATNDEPVKVVVGKTFDSIVLDESKDVMVEFYAPWCGHCKSLAPIYDEVAKTFEKVPSVVVAKIDSTENDSPADIQGFPTLIFYPAGNKKGISFEGDRTKDAIISFIVKHGSAATKADAAAADVGHEHHDHEHEHHDHGHNEL